MNKLRVYEVCRSLHSVFICVLPSIPPFSGLGLTAAGCCSCVFCFVFDFIETFFSRTESLARFVAEPGLRSHVHCDRHGNNSKSILCHNLRVCPRSSSPLWSRLLGERFANK